MDDQAKQRELDRLIAMMRRGNKFSTDAVRELQANDWLADGSLQGQDLRGVDLSEDSLSYADLSEVDLRYADLSRIWLMNSTLHGTDLRQSKMPNAFIKQSDLRGAKLCGMDGTQIKLVESDLRGSVLVDANLSGALLLGSDVGGTDLTKTNFSGALIGGSSFENARMNRTIFADVSFEYISGLDSVYHDGPSSIGVDTLYRAKGTIPKVFLRGCGVPENLIDKLPSLIEGGYFHRCFISYSHSEKLFAEKLYQILQNAGVRCWFDEKDMRIGDDMYESVHLNIGKRDKFLLCSSKAALNSWWVDSELNSAFHDEQTLSKELGESVRKVIPLDLDGYLLGDYQGKWKSQLTSRLVGNFTGWEHDNNIFEREIEKVILALRSDDGAREQPPPSLH